jgi:3-oxoadipate enol-lactonase
VGAALSEERFLELEGATLRVRCAGDGPAVVLVHGWALDLDMWRAQMESLSRHHRVVAFDRRGFGRSSGVPGIEDDVADLEHLLQRLNIDRAALVGMSQGARVALRWALKHPERTSCLVLDGTPAEALAPLSGGEEIPIDDYRERLRRDGIEAFLQAWLHHPFMQLRTSELEAHRLLREIAARYPARDLQMNERPQLQLLGMQDLRRLQVPTLVLSGEFDSPQRRSVARHLAQTLPDARLQVLKGAGHLAALDDPAAYSRALLDFFARQPAMSAGTAV